MFDKFSFFLELPSSTTARSTGIVFLEPRKIHLPYGKSLYGLYNISWVVSRLNDSAAAVKEVCIDETQPVPGGELARQMVALKNDISPDILDSRCHVRPIKRVPRKFVSTYVIADFRRRKRYYIVLHYGHLTALPPALFPRKTPERRFFYSYYRYTQRRRGKPLIRDAGALFDSG